MITAQPLAFVRSCLLWGAAFAVVSPAAPADAADGSIRGIAIATWQQAAAASVSGRPVRDEPSAALDLSASLPAWGGAFELELKGATTPRGNGVTRALSVANAAVGETLDNDRGRIIPWQLYYRHGLGNGSVAAGLIDATGWLDGNDIAADEFTQFMGVTFVHNPAIDLPAASAGVAYSAGLGHGFGLAAVVSNATGVEPRYRRAFDLGRHGSGAFAALEAQWTGGALSVNLGGWLNTRNHDTDGDGVDDDRLGEGHASGVYGNLSGSLGAGRWNLRAGWADPDIQSTAAFLGVAYSRPVGDAVVGAGASRTYASSRIDEPHADLSQLEVYARMPLTRHLSFTADLQRIAHPGFDPSQSGVWVTGARVGWSF